MGKIPFLFRGKEIPSRRGEGDFCRRHHETRDRVPHRGQFGEISLLRAKDLASLLELKELVREGRDHHLDVGPLLIGLAHLQSFGLKLDRCERLPIRDIPTVPNLRIGREQNVGGQLEPHPHGLVSVGFGLEPGPGRIEHVLDLMDGVLQKRELLSEHRNPSRDGGIGIDLNLHLRDAIQDKLDASLPEVIGLLIRLPEDLQGLLH